LRSCEQQTHNSFSRPEADKDATQTMKSAVMQTTSGLADKGGVEGLKAMEEASDLISAVERDFDGGCQVGLDMKWVWGRK
jgi:hypothetical protein